MRMRRVRRTCVSRVDMTIRKSWSPVCVHRQFIPDGRPAPVGPVRHACTSSFGTNPICPDGTESRALTSPQSTAKRIHGQVGDSRLQHATLRFGLFSFSCPRLLCVRPTEAIAGPLLRRRSRSRRIQTCKERTMRRRTRPHGRGNGPDPNRAAEDWRECFESETTGNGPRDRRRPAPTAGVAGVERVRRPCVRACAMPTIRLRLPDPGRASTHDRTRSSIPRALRAAVAHWNVGLVHALPPVREVIEAIAEHGLPILHDEQSRFIRNPNSTHAANDVACTGWIRLRARLVPGTAVARPPRHRPAIRPERPARMAAREQPGPNASATRNRPPDSTQTPAPLAACPIRIVIDGTIRLRSRSC